MTIGIMGASKFGLAVLENRIVDVVSTPFGDQAVERGAINDVEVVWLRRFGWGDNLPSHQVNHRAHIAAFGVLNVRRVFTLNGFGGVNPELRAGDLVVAHDYIKFLHRDPPSILPGLGWPRVDVGAAVGGPYCPEIRKALVESARATSQRRVWDRGVNACVQGPHLETEAEVEALRRLGADLVSTTIYPELIYARELGICLASLCWISDMAGTASTKDWLRISTDEVAAILTAAVQRIPPEPQSCQCQTAWKAEVQPKQPWYHRDEIRSTAPA